MKKQFNVLVATVLVISFVACSKSSAPTPSDPNPNITLNGTTTDVTDASKAFYTSSVNNDTIVIVNSTATSVSVINSINNINALPSTTNFLSLQILNNNTISQTTYSFTTGSSSVGVIATIQVGGTKYSSLNLLPCTVTVDTLNSTFISGSYSATVKNVSNLNDYTTPSISGRFKANF